MPFTLVHPAFLLPFEQKFGRYMHPLALIAGSFAPDFDIVFRFTETRFHIFDFGFKCVFLQILPLAILTVFIYSYFLRDFIIQKCPKAIAQIGEDIEPFFIKSNVKSYLFVVLNCIVAIYLHLFLDLISHFDAWGIKAFFKSYISDNEIFIEIIYWSSIYLPMLLITLLGVLLYIKYGKKYYNIFQIKDFLHTKVYLFLILAILCSIPKILFSGLNLEFGIDVLVISGLNGLFLALMIYGFVFTIKSKLKPTQ
jgi:hypothetical protein